MKYLIHLLIIIFSMTVSSCASSHVSVPVHGIYVHADFAGVAHVGDTGMQSEYDHIEYAGARWTLRTFNWNRVEPNQGEWDFSFTDAYIDGLNNAGVKIIGLLAYSNRWAYADDTRTGRFIDSHKLPYFLEYVRRMTERYKGKVIQEGFNKSLRAFWFDRKTDGSGALVIWNEGFGSRQITLNLPGIEHLIHNIVTGESNSVSQEIQIRVGREPVFITWQNIQY